jgi:hypothetical protein
MSLISTGSISLDSTFKGPHIFYDFTSVADPRSSAFIDPWIRDGKKPGSGSAMNNPNHISESLEIIVMGQNTEFL